MACAKHFPGHGDTELDSHTDLPIVEQERGRIEDVELAPFREAARRGVSSFMTAHVVYPALDTGLPATLSQTVLGLARAIPFEGVIVSDDLEMAAVAAQFEGGEAAVLAVRAGCDLLLCCRDVVRQEAAVRGLFDAVISGRIASTALWDADRRVEAMSVRFPNGARPPLTVIGRDEHLDLAERIRAASAAASE
jgi:beta-N-acetylhexosaminidase